MVMLLPGLHLQYAPTPVSAADNWTTATALATHAAPDIRLKAVRLLSSLAKQHADGATAVSVASQAQVDAAFLTLCSVVSNDVVAAIRVEALAGLAELHHVSRAVKQQALSKRATLRVAPPATTLPQLGSTAAVAAADGGLLDSATGAFVHAVEDDTSQVRIAAVAAVLSLGSQDMVFAEEAAMLLVDLISDELVQVRLVALQGLLQWASAHVQQQQSAKRQKTQRQQQQTQCDLESQQQYDLEKEANTVARPRPPQQQEQQAGMPVQLPISSTGKQLQLQQQPEQCKQSDELMLNAEQQQQHNANKGQQQGQQQQQEPADVEEQLGLDDEEEDEEGELQDEAETVHVLQGQQQQQHEAAQQHIGSSTSKSGKKPNKKKRKSDLPSWGTDAQAAAASALRDQHAAVRHKALQLLQLLPAANMPAVMHLLQGLIACCEHFGAQHKEPALGVIRQLVQQRTMLVARSAQNIAKLLARAISSTAEPLIVEQQRQGCVGFAAIPLAGQQPQIALELLSEVVVGTVTIKPQMLPSLYMHLEKQGIRHAAALQQLLSQLDMAAQQQQQQ